ncbi:MAG: PAS domain S-box protein [Magnetococcales bacterium]|nr:PAS domain S-box protein [Magnetococcales bacterium]
MNAPVPKILLVNDHLPNPENVALLLSSLPVQVVEAHTVSQALGMMLDRDLIAILLDADMPELNGVELAATLREIDTTRRIPILFLTDDPGRRVKNCLSGGVDFLEKPVNGALLLSKVEVCLEMYRMRCAQEETLARLRQSEATLRAMIDHVGIGMTRVDLQGRILESNLALATMLGYPDAESLVGMSVAEITHPEEREANAMLHQQVIRGALPSSRWEKRYLKRDGSTVWGRVTVTLIPQAGTSGPFLVAAIEDISEFKGLIARLEESENRFRSIFEHAPVAYQSLNREGCFIDTNPILHELLGYEREEILGRSFGEMWSPGSQEAFSEAYSHFLHTGATRGELELVARDGSSRTVLLDGRVQRDSQGGFARTHCVLFDISNRKRMEEALREAKAQAERANRAKSEFLANMSHEIRTPLNAILGMGELLEERDLDETERRYVQIFRGAGEVLLSVINDVLDMAKIEAGELSLESIPFRLRELVTTNTEIIALRARSKGLVLRSEIAADVPDPVMGDPLRISQVLLNLLGNAIKFTEKGQVMLRVDDLREIPSGIEVRFSVSDTGIGIAPEKLQAIFSPFSQADNSITRRFGGTGLGLSISRRLVQAMGGELSVDSRVGEGSTFRFRVSLGRDLSIAQPSAATGMRVEAIEALRQRPLRLLVAEDALDNRLLLSAFLNQTALTLDFAENGREAVNRFIRGRYDLVLMDVQMPDMDGFSATRAIRAWERDNGLEPTPILALTAYALHEDVEKARAAGCTAHLAKPIKKKTLFAALAEHAPPLPNPVDAERT